MKKILILAAAAAMMLAGAQTAKAQLYFGGSLGYSTTSVKDAAGNSTSGSSFKFMPEVGFRINDRMAVGGTVGYMQGFGALGSADPNDYKALILTAGGSASDMASRNNRMSGFRFAPYFRFTIINGRRFDLFVDGGFAFTSATTTSLNGNVWQKTGSNSVIEVGVKPGFLIKFDSHFSVIGRLGNLGIQSLSNKDANGNTIAGNTTRAGFDLDSNNILLGFVYSL